MSDRWGTRVALLRMCLASMGVTAATGTDSATQVDGLFAEKELFDPRATNHRACAL